MRGLALNSLAKGLHLKHLSYALLFFFNFLVIANSIAQEATSQKAKLVRQAEWGSGEYQAMVEINGYYYIETSANQIDVINPQLSGNASLVGQINLDISDTYSEIYTIAKFKEYLVIVSNDDLTIYSISEAINFTKLYSIQVEGGILWQKSITSQGDYLYFVDGNSRLYKIKHEANSFNLVKVIQLENNDYDNGLSINNRSLFIEGSSLFYLYQKHEGGQNSAVIEQYQLSDLSLLGSGENSNFEYFQDVTLAGNGRFIISTYGKIRLVQLVDSKVIILDDFESLSENDVHLLAFKGGIASVLSWRKIFRQYQIEDYNKVTLLNERNLTNSFATNSSFFQYFGWVNEKLMGLSNSLGLFEIGIVDNSLENIDFYYNQSGYLGAAAIKDNYLYLPRDERVDIVDMSDTNNFKKINEHNVKARNIISFDSEFIFSHNRQIANYSIENESELILNSSVKNTDIQDDTLIRHDEFIYYINFDNGYKLYRYELDNPYAFYESPTVINFPEMENSCPQQLNIVNNKLLAFDFCGDNKVHILKDIDSENFSYEQSFALDLEREFWRVATVNDYIYFIDPRGINIAKLTETNELKVITYIDTRFSETSGINKAAILDDYLVVAGSHNFHLLDVAVADSPKLISKTSLRAWEWSDANFQLVNDTLLVTTKQQGQIKFFKLNYAPELISAQVEIDEDTSVDINELFEDPEGDEISYEVITAPEHGEVSAFESLYTPNQDFYGEDKFTVKVADVHGNFIEREITVSVLPVNDVPVIVTTKVELLEDAKLVESIEAIDVDGDQLSYAIEEQSTHGISSINEKGEFTYTPDVDYNGNDSAIIVITDAHDATASRIITIFVESVNDLPEIISDTFEGIEDNTVEGQITATDIEAQKLSFSVLADSAVNGQVAMQTDGQFVFMPTENFFGQASFIAQVTDTEQGRTQQIILINIEGENDSPVAETFSVSVSHNSAVSDTLVASDIDGDSLEYTLVSDVTHGTLSLSLDGSYNYAPNNGYSGSDSFVYEVSDGKSSVQGTVTFSVQAAPKIDTKDTSSSSGGGGSMNILFLCFVIFSNWIRISRQ